MQINLLNKTDNYFMLPTVENANNPNNKKTNITIISKELLMLLAFHGKIEHPNYSITERAVPLCNSKELDNYFLFEDYQALVVCGYTKSQYKTMQNNQLCTISNLSRLGEKQLKEVKQHIINKQKVLKDFIAHYQIKSLNLPANQQLIISHHKYDEIIK